MLCVCVVCVVCGCVCACAHTSVCLHVHMHVCIRYVVVVYIQQNILWCRDMCDNIPIWYSAPCGRFELIKDHHPSLSVIRGDDK